MDLERKLKRLTPRKLVSFVGPHETNLRPPSSWGPTNKKNLVRHGSVSTESSSQVKSNAYIETSNTNVNSNIHINASESAVSTVSSSDTVA